MRHQPTLVALSLRLPVCVLLDALRFPKRNLCRARNVRCARADKTIWLACFGMDTARTYAIHIFGTHAEITVLGERLLNILDFRRAAIPAMPSTRTGRDNQRGCELPASSLEAFTHIG